MKNKVFEINHCNFGEFSFLGDWVKTNMIIYDDFTVDIVDYFSDHKDLKEEKRTIKFAEEVFYQIKEIMDKLDEYEEEIESYDGSAWEYIYYKNNEIYKKRKLGYVYGIEKLEKLNKILNNFC